MKIWLNNRKVKETNHYIMCNKCVFLRKSGYGFQCLANIFNLQYNSSVCELGYQYEDNV